MKTTTYLRATIIALVMANAVACTEPPVTPSTTVTPLAHQEFLMVAKNWINQGSGYFLNQFSNVIVANPSQYTVYLYKDNVRTLISGGSIDLNGDRLWAEIDGANLSILYSHQPTDPMPFKSLQIILVLDSQ